MKRNDMETQNIGKRVNASSSKLTMQKKAIDHNPAGRTIPMADSMKSAKSSKKMGY